MLLGDEIEAEGHVHNNQLEDHVESELSSGMMGYTKKSMKVIQRDLDLISNECEEKLRSMRTNDEMRDVISQVVRSQAQVAQEIIKGAVTEFLRKVRQPAMELEVRCAEVVSAARRDQCFEKSMQRCEVVKELQESVGEAEEEIILRVRELANGHRRDELKISEETDEVKRLNL